MSYLIGLDSFRSSPGVYEISRIYVFSNTPDYDWKKETDLVILLMINALQYGSVTGHHDIRCNMYYTSVMHDNEFVFSIARYIPNMDH